MTPSHQHNNSVIGPLQTNDQVTHAPQGFRFNGLACGIKPSGKPDLVLIDCPDSPHHPNQPQGVSAAALLTRNQVRAAPLIVTAENLRTSAGRCRAILINAGCANAATGEEGLRRARLSVDLLASALGCQPHEILINSTGVIGHQLPIGKIEAALPELIGSASPDHLHRAAEAMLTTDLVKKVAAVEITLGDRTVRILGLAKGSGMIHPDMATMIAVIMTDAAIEPAALDAMLRIANEQSFHRITVDGDTSTNDSVFALASGVAGEVPPDVMQEAMSLVLRELALMIVRDGEGARKLLRVVVTGAKDQPAALAVAKTVAMSLLVRTAVAGGDPNWGRILAAIGRSGVEVNLDQLRVSAGSETLFADGTPTPGDQTAREAAFAGPEVNLTINLGDGPGTDRFHTCDLTEGYIRINADYTT